MPKTESATIRVESYVVIGTSERTYQAWEPTDGYFSTQHSTLQSFDGQVYGLVTSRRLTPELDALPRGDERISAVKAYYANLNVEAYEAILTAHPWMRQCDPHLTHGDVRVPACMARKYDEAVR